MLYESIFRRKSTRKYLPEALPKDQLDDILTFAQNAVPLHKQIKIQFEIAVPNQVKGMVSAKAPHYLLLYSQKEGDYLMNAGFILQQVDLYLSSQGLGSCWLGVAKTPTPEKDGLHYVIMLAFGKAQGDVHRKDLSEFNRRELSEIADGDDERLSSVRLAPSAGNTQPWYFVCDKDSIYVYRKKFGKLKAALYGSMNHIDMGIGLCHLYLASEKKEKPFSFTSYNKTESFPPKDGYEYVGKVV